MEETDKVLTKDLFTDNYIQLTDNSLKEGDSEGIHQEPRLLTEEEIAKTIENATDNAK